MANLERIESIRRRIADYEKRKEGLRKTYEDTVSDINAAVTELKVELADIVLSEQNGETEGKKTFVSVKFNDKGKIYDYLWDSQEEVNVGDMVEVESRWHGMQAVVVVKVFTEYAEYMDYDYKSAYPLSVRENVG